MTGTFSDDAGDYSPAALVLLDFTWRLSGVRRLEDSLEWNIRPPAEQANRFQLRVSPTMTAEMQYAPGQVELYINGKLLFRSAATVRLVTDQSGKLKTVVGTDSAPTKAVVRDASGHDRAFSIKPNEVVSVGR